MVQSLLLDLLVHVKTFEISLSFSNGNLSKKHSFRIKLSNLAQANTSSACVLYGNGGAFLKIVNHDLSILNNLSIVFLNEA